MENKRSLILTIMCLPVFLANTFGQQTVDINKSRSQLLVYSNQGMAVNSVNVKNDNVYPNSVQAASATGYTPSIDIEFQRISKKGLMYGFGLEMGSKNQDFNVVYPTLDFLDPARQLQSTAPGIFKYAHHSLYAGIRAFIGYTFPINFLGANDLNIETKLGVTKTIYLSGGVNYDVLSASVSKNDTMYVYQIADVHDTWGNGGRALSGPVVGDLYIGIRKDVHAKIMNSLYLGFYSTYRVSYPKGKEYIPSGEVIVSNFHYDNGTKVSTDADIYNSKELAFGVRLGIGLKL